jgi:hypothetical protein
MTEKDEFRDLTEECGHHCGKVTVGQAGKHVAHCNGCHTSNDKRYCLKETGIAHD